MNNCSYRTFSSVNTTVIDYGLHLSKFGAITSAKFAVTISIAACTFFPKKNCKRLADKEIMVVRLFIVGRRLTRSLQASICPIAHATRA